MTMTTNTIAPPKDRAAANGYDREAELAALHAKYPQKVEPMPDAPQQQPLILYMLWALLTLFERSMRKVSMFSDIFIFYDEGNSDARVAPDLFIALDVDPDDLVDERSYFAWLHGKVPELVLEIGSPSTANYDKTGKLRLYERIGVEECWLVDASGGDYYGFPLRGHRLADGGYREIEAGAGTPAGSVHYRSEVLGLDFCWLDDRGLRLYDPQTARYLPTRAEIVEALESAEASAAAVQAENAELRARLSRLEDR